MLHNTVEAVIHEVPVCCNECKRCALRSSNQCGEFKTRLMGTEGQIIGTKNLKSREKMTLDLTFPVSEKCIF